MGAAPKLRVVDPDAPAVVVPDFLVGSLAAPIVAILPAARLVAIDADGRLGAPVGEAIALLRYFPNDRYERVFAGEAFDRVLDALPGLRLVQIHGAGVDGLLTARLEASGAALCNASTLHSGPMAESVLALILAAAKRIPFHVRHQLEHRWRRSAKAELAGSRVTIVGYGRIGAEVARLCRAFRMEVTGVRRRPEAAAAQDGVRVVGLERLDEAIAEADYLVLALPLHPRTRGLIDARRLDRLRPPACLINVARGEVVDEDALTERLADGRIAFACLDTFRVEPLPPSHPLWDLPNVLITPHNSASSPHMEARVVDLFLDNLARLARGAPLVNQVHPPAANAVTGAP